MFRWMVSRPALFASGVIAGIWGTHHFGISQPGPEVEPVVATATKAVSPKTAEAAQRFEPLPETDDNAEHLPIQRIAGVSVVERNPQQVGDKGRGENSVVAVVPVSAGTPKVGRAHVVAETNPVAMRALARSIQRELVRAGCRSVSISGRWDSRSVSASAKFLSNRNALLPSDHPDVILLSMLRGYQGGECGLAEQERTTGAQVATGVAQPVTIRSASRPPGGTYVAAIQGGAESGQSLDTPAGSPLPGAAEADATPRPTSVRSTRRRSSSKARARSPKQNWRRKFFGNGLDG